MSLSKSADCQDLQVHRVFAKVYVRFHCSNEKCGKLWKSVHAWSEKEVAHCGECGVQGRLIHLIDQDTWFDVFKCCSSPWQRIHLGDPEEDERCNFNRKVTDDRCADCGNMVKPQGLQKRYARLYYFKCWNDNCSQPNWDDFSFEEYSGQRCSSANCFSRGNIVEVIHVKPRPSKYDRHLPHVVDCCDMCEKLKSCEGKQQRCPRFQEVQISAEVNDDGAMRDKVVRLVPLEDDNRKVKLVKAFGVERI